MIERFKNFINEEHLFADGRQVLLAVSGGRDSVTLCDLMARAGYDFAIAHCNFHLRPGDCDRDEAFVRQLAANYGALFFVTQFDTVDYAKEHGLSIEEAARTLRYDYFFRLCRDEHFDAVATAHHRDDAIETFFINLLRGTGVSGLHGIKVRNGNVVRPMLCFSRNDVDNYVKERGLHFVEDTTNAETQFLRNRIRHQVLPLFRDISPSFDETMDGNMARLREVEQLYKLVVDDDRARLLKPNESGFAVDIMAVRGLVPLKTRLFELLRPFGFNSAVVDDILSALDSQSGKQFFSASHRILKDREQLLIEPFGDNDVSEYLIDRIEERPQLPIAMSMRISEYHGESVRLAENEAWYDYDRVHFPLTLRRWRHGDRFVPFGMKGSRLVSDFFSDMKLSLSEKEQTWLLCDAEGRILWVVGKRASGIARVDSDTRQVMQLKV